MEATPWYERHPRAAVGLAALVGIAGVLLLAEVWCRVFIPQWAPVTAERAHFWQFDPDLGWSQVPLRHGSFQHPDFVIDVSINSLGLRDREYPVARNEKKRMLVLGDSYGWGFGVNHDEIFTELMEAKHPDWEIINASVSGYGTVQEYLYLQKRGILLKPDVVLVLFFDNDFQDNMGNTEYWYHKPVVTQTADGFSLKADPVSAPSWAEQLNIALMGNFYLARGLFAVFQPAQDAADTAGELEQNKHSPDSLAATRYVMGQMMTFARQQGIKLVVVETPLSEVKHAALQASCDAFAVPCLHLNKVFRRNTRDWHFEHDRHWNVKGHKMAAEAIDTYLQNEGIWSK